MFSKRKNPNILLSPLCGIPLFSKSLGRERERETGHTNKNLYKAGHSGTSLKHCHLGSTDRSIMSLKLHRETLSQKLNFKFFE
jgi:hypothetical protein